MIFSNEGEDGRAYEAGVGVADLERGGVTVHGPPPAVAAVRRFRGSEGMESGMEIMERRFGLGDLSSNEDEL